MWRLLCTVGGAALGETTPKNTAGFIEQRVGLVFESFLAFSRMQTRAVSASGEQTLGSFGFARGHRAGDVYGEEAFRHFLSIERVRAERCSRSLLLLLISLRKREERDHHHISRPLSAALFSGLGQSVREVDFVGWYREGQVAGAVLTQGLGGPCSDARVRIVERVTTILGKGLPRQAAERLRVRLVHLGPRTT
jgi:hypothetical protein